MFLLQELEKPNNRDFFMVQAFSIRTKKNKKIKESYKDLGVRRLNLWDPKKIEEIITKTQKLKNLKLHNPSKNKYKHENFKTKIVE